jgi:hypothetical protein
MSARLTYEHRTECLTGTVGTKTFHLYAASGGNRASTKLRDRVTRVTFDPAQPGAALPKGKYRPAFLGKPYKHYSDGAVLLWPEKKILERYKTSKRTFNNFLIHAPGPVGSEGCIVSYRRSDAKALSEERRQGAAQGFPHHVRQGGLGGQEGRRQMAWLAGGPRRADRGTEVPNSAND